MSFVPVVLMFFSCLSPCKQRTKSDESSDHQRARRLGRSGSLSALRRRDAHAEPDHAQARAAELRDSRDVRGRQPYVFGQKAHAEQPRRDAAQHGHALEQRRRPSGVVALVGMESGT